MQGLTAGPSGNQSGFRSLIKSNLKNQVSAQQTNSGYPAHTSSISNKNNLTQFSFTANNFYDKNAHQLSGNANYGMRSG